MQSFEVDHVSIILTTTLHSEQPFVQTHEMTPTHYTVNYLTSILGCIDLITNLKDSQREGVCKLLLAGDEVVSCSSVHVNAGQSVHLGVHPVQTLVDHVCPKGAGTQEGMLKDI